jgi:hypothetical protein
MSAVMNTATGANPAAAAEPVGGDVSRATNPGTLPLGEIPQAAFDDMGLRVGDRMQLAPPPKLEGDPCMVRLIGYVRDVSLLVTAPPPGCWRAPVIEGDNVVMRVFSGRSAFGFVCQVDKVVRLPFEYLHLSFPRLIAGRVIRRSRRIKADIPVKIDGGACAAGNILNVSSTGAEVSTDAAPGDSGATIGLTFTLNVHGVETPLALKAAIRSVRESAGESGPTWRCGVEFQDVPMEAAAALKSLIYQELIERPQSVM